MQAGQLIASTLRQNLDAPVVIVTNPSGDGQNVGFAFYEPAEADALDASTNDEATRLDRLFGR